MNQNCTKKIDRFVVSVQFVFDSYGCGLKKVRSIANVDRAKLNEFEFQILNIQIFSIFQILNICLKETCRVRLFKYATFLQPLH